MTVRREKRRDPISGAEREFWIVDVVFEHANGRQQRVRKVAPLQTRRAAEQYERDLRHALADGSYGKEVPTFDKWFNGRFWEDWVVARQNKPSEVENKKAIYKNHLEARFGQKRLDEITDEAIAEFKRALLASELSHKSIDNILTVLSTPLKFAHKKKIIADAPEVGLFHEEPPEIVVWEFSEYVALLEAAKQLGSEWTAAFCLGGEAGLRVGEIRALEWKRDVDMVGRTITVNAQTRKGVTGTPKGRMRRTVPITDTLFAALRGLGRIRVGFVICNEDGTAKDDAQTEYAARRACELAGLPERRWHVLRHTFATDLARFGVNPWSLQHWLGHKRMDQTMAYVAYAKDHARPVPERIFKSAEGELDPDRRVLKMLGARSANGNLTATEKDEKAG